MKNAPTKGNPARFLGYHAIKYLAYLLQQALGLGRLETGVMG